MVVARLAMQRTIYNLACSHDATGLTCEETEDILEGIHQSVSPRFVEMATTGCGDPLRWCLRIVGYRRNRSRRRANVYRVIDVSLSFTEGWVSERPVQPHPLPDLTDLTFEPEPEPVTPNGDDDWAARLERQAEEARNRDR